MSNARSVLINAIKNGSPTRAIYDSFIDYASENGCFVNQSGENRMFEAYSTLIDFTRITRLMNSLMPYQVTALKTALADCNFTPLASVLRSFLEKQFPDTVVDDEKAWDTLMPGKGVEADDNF